MRASIKHRMRVRFWSLAACNNLIFRREHEMRKESARNALQYLELEDGALDARHIHCYTFACTIRKQADEHGVHASRWRSELHCVSPWIWSTTHEIPLKHCARAWLTGNAHRTTIRCNCGNALHSVNGRTNKEEMHATSERARGKNEKIFSADAGNRFSELRNK